MDSVTIAPLLAGNIIGSNGDAFVIAEWRADGGSRDAPMFIAPLHLHRSDDEAWYVLEGTLCVRVGENVVEAVAGSAVFVPRGTAHTYWNPEPVPARYLLVMTPNIRRLIDDIHAMPDRNWPALVTMFEKYDSELLG